MWINVNERGVVGILGRKIGGGVRGSSSNINKSRFMILHVPKHAQLTSRRQ